MRPRRTQDFFGAEPEATVWENKFVLLVHNHNDCGIIASESQVSSQQEVANKEVTNFNYQMDMVKDQNGDHVKLDAIRLNSIDKFASTR